MSEIFISYSRKDAQFVARLVADLEKAQWNVFYDLKLKPSQDYGKELQRELSLANYVVVVLSSNSLAPTSKVRTEVITALQLEREGQTTVIPLLIEPCKAASINNLIGTKMYANFTGDYGTGFVELSSSLVKPRVNGRGGTKMPSRKQKGIIAAVIGAIVTLVPAYWQFVYKRPEPPAPLPIQYAGRVIDSVSEKSIRGAKVTFETEGVPTIYSTDSDGVFYLNLPASSSGTARIRVEANGYEKFDRNVSLSRTGIEEVRLTTLPSPTPSPSVGSNSNSNKANTNEQEKIDRITKSASANKPS